MSQWEHERKDGYISAMRAIQASAKDDLDAKRGLIKPAIVKWSEPDAKIHSVSAHIVQWWRKRA